MPLYFLLLDAHDFHGRLHPALADSWRRRSFEPCRHLCAELSPAARAFAERYHLGPDEPLLFRVAQGLPFDRDFWRALAGEVLWFSAAEIPELQTTPQALALLLGQDPDAEDTPIHQAHYGSRDLTFGSAFYRPGQAGLNDQGDVVRLAGYLDALRPEEWSAERLAALGLDEDDRAEELEYVRDWFAPLHDLYGRARQQGQILVCEILGEA